MEYELENPGRSSAQAVFSPFLVVNTVEFQPFSKIPVKSHISLLIPAIVLWSEL